MNAPHLDVEQVEAANTAFYEALEEGDFEKVSEFWLTPSDLGVDESYHDPADAGVVSCVHPGWPVLTGRGEVLRSYALIMANTDYIQFFLTDVHVSVTGDTALVTCTENILSGRPRPRRRRGARPARRPARRRHQHLPAHTRRLEALVPPRLPRTRGNRGRGRRGHTPLTRPTATAPAPAPGTSHRGLGTGDPGTGKWLESRTGG